MTAAEWVLVALGAAAGASLRYALGHVGDRRGRLPWGTLVANLVGSFVLGVLVGLETAGRPHALLALGFCGALTTYSAFAVQTHNLGWRRGALLVVLTLPPATLLCWLGSQL